MTFNRWTFHRWEDALGKHYFLATSWWRIEFVWQKGIW